jgi:predicted nucleotide-binding protein (sugar kinase/HSP70/actin superfamily)
MKSVMRRLAAKTHTSSAKARNEILPLLRHIMRGNEALYDDLSTWMLETPEKKLGHLRYMSYKKKQSDFVSLENYAKYKQREMKKMIDNIAKETETDRSNIERWLTDEKKNAKWNK